MGSKGAKSEITKYFMSVHFGICSGPIDALDALYIGEKVAWDGNRTEPGTFDISKPNLFGGNKKEGGVSGKVHFLPGDDDQVMPNVLANKFGLTSADCPAYRGMASVFFHNNKKGFYWCANNPYLKSVWAKVRRRPRGLPSGIAMIDGNANPAHIIYECLTNTDWGMGSPTSAIDYDNFVSVAQTLFDEDFGISILWVQQSSIEDFITIILSHIDGLIFIHPRTGLFTLKLARADYDIDDLPIINPDNATLSNFQRKTWGETTNEINVSWTNPRNEKSQTVTAQNLANIAIQGQPVSDSRNYEGVRNKNLAMRLAQRDLRAVSHPLFTCEAIVNREGWDLTPGSVVVLQWPEHGIAQAVMRVGPVDYGKTTDSQIKLSLAEDIFGLDHGEFEDPPDTEWVDTSEEPAPLVWSLLFTAPYYVLVKSILGGADSDTTDVIPAILGAQTGDDTSAFLASYEVDNAAGVPEMRDGTALGVVSRSLLVDDLPFEVTSTVSITAPSQGEGPVVGGLAFLGTADDTMEISVITAYDDDTFSVTLRRGVLDTIPRVWLADTPIWFASEEDPIVVPELYPPGTPVEYFLRPTTSLGTLEAEDADTVEGVLTERPWLPHRPANVKINDIASGFIDAIGDTDMSVTWSNRNRLLEDTVIMAWNESTVSPEDGQTTTIEVVDADNTVITAHVGLTGTSFTLPVTSFGSATVATVRVLSVIDDQRSIQWHEFTVQVADVGYGAAYGIGYGGTA